MRNPLLFSSELFVKRAQALPAFEIPKFDPGTKGPTLDPNNIQNLMTNIQSYPEDQRQAILDTINENYGAARHQGGFFGNVGGEIKNIGSSIGNTFQAGLNSIGDTLFGYKPFDTQDSDRFRAKTVLENAAQNPAMYKNVMQGLQGIGMVKNNPAAKPQTTPTAAPANSPAQAPAAATQTPAQGPATAPKAPAQAPVAATSTPAPTQTQTPAQAPTPPAPAPVPSQASTTQPAAPTPPAPAPVPSQASTTQPAAPAPVVAQPSPAAAPQTQAAPNLVSAPGGRQGMRAQRQQLRQDMRDFRQQRRQALGLGQNNQQAVSPTPAATAPTQPAVKPTGGTMNGRRMSEVLAEMRNRQAGGVLEGQQGKVNPTQQAELQRQRNPYAGNYSYPPVTRVQTGNVTNGVADSPQTADAISRIGQARQRANNFFRR